MKLTFFIECLKKCSNTDSFMCLINECAFELNLDSSTIFLTNLNEKLTPNLCLESRFRLEHSSEISWS